MRPQRQNRGVVSRRKALAGAFSALGWSAFHQPAAEAQERRRRLRPGRGQRATPDHQAGDRRREAAMALPEDPYRRGNRRPGRADRRGSRRTVATAIQEIAPYLVGKDPRHVVHHWQAIYRHAFYRGGPILTSALSGIDMALWDIKGKALGVPVYELLGGPTRDRVRVYAHARTPEQIQRGRELGFTAFKTSPAKRRPARYVETPGEVEVHRRAIRRDEESRGRRRRHRH